MEEPQNQPIYWDKHRIPFNLTIIFSLAVAVFGLYTFVSGNTGSFDGRLITVLGLGSAAYSWLTNPRTYLVYTDTLFIMYGKPRTKAIPFSNISHLEMRQLATPDRLRVWLLSGRRVVLMAKDPEEFHDQLQKALDDFRKAHPEYAVAEPDRPEESPPAIDSGDL